MSEQPAVEELKECFVGFYCQGESYGFMAGSTLAATVAVALVYHDFWLSLGTVGWAVFIGVYGRRTVLGGLAAVTPSGDKQP